MKRRQARRANGRFTRNTMENTFGMSVDVCPNPDCRRFLPRSMFEPRPESCPHCGTKLPNEEVSK